jgi:hypothetical protein
MSDVNSQTRYQDPTALTTEMILRELSSLEKRISVRLDGVEKANETFQDNLTRVPTEVDKAMHGLRDLHASELAGLRDLLLEKFRGIGTQISERDAQGERTARDNKVAIDAALSAQKEAVNEQNKSNALANTKMEASFTKQIDQLGDLVRSMTNGLSDKIDDMKARVTIIESHSKGLGDGWGYLVGAIATMGVLVVLVIDLLHK